MEEKQIERERERVPDDVRISGKHTQDGDFAKSGGWDTFIVFMETCLFECNDLPGGFLPCSVHFPVSSLSYFL